MAKFEDSIEYVVWNETSGRSDGAYTNDPVDKGGATKWGISSLIARQYGFDTAEKIKAMTKPEALRIYRAEFWRFDAIDNQNTATKLFDMVVNLGSVRAVQIAQVACVWAGIPIKVDGRYGGATAAALNTISSKRFFACLMPLLEAYYYSRVNLDQSQRRFIDGWLNRARRLPR